MENVLVHIILVDIDLKQSSVPIVMSLLIQWLHRILQESQSGTIDDHHQISHCVCNGCNILHCLCLCVQNQPIGIYLGNIDDYGQYLWNHCISIHVGIRIGANAHSYI